MFIVTTLPTLYPAAKISISLVARKVLLCLQILLVILCYTCFCMHRRGTNPCDTTEASARSYGSGVRWRRLSLWRPSPPSEAFFASFPLLSRGRVHHLHWILVFLIGVPGPVLRYSSWFVFIGELIWQHRSSHLVVDSFSLVNWYGQDRSNRCLVTSWNLESINLKCIYGVHSVPTIYYVLTWFMSSTWQYFASHNR